MKETTLDELGWTQDDLALKVIKPGSLKFDNLTMAARTRGPLEAPATVLYDALALRYNDAEVGELILFNLPNKPSAGNLRKTFESRGLRDLDYRLFRPLFDENGERYPANRRPLVLQKLAETPMKTIRPYPAIARRLAKQAEERGTAYNYAQLTSLDK